MSIILFCLVKGNTTANAFPVRIDKEQFIGDLKKAIKAEKQNDFAGVDADELKLWKKEIPDDQDDLLSNLILNDEPELLATREIGDYWTEKPPKRHIHVIVKLPRKCLGVWYSLYFSSFAFVILTRIRFQFSAWKRRCRVFCHP
ncbi:hypothetical protein RclHR1_31570004 [Rhizophagus clarus]|uniref:Crinkler effector protein N-terminal domain-containing protein n=1 Tax=Rhizophagus clarus TaxID=94130 RepID=A0A2Z6S2F5_9GLOM|nr:hypothetical protein RclHR1_31570004 [Rhizophagus clarus]